MRGIGGAWQYADGVARGVLGQALAQQLDATPAAFRESGRAQRDPENTRGVVGLGERKLLSR